MPKGRVGVREEGRAGVELRPRVGAGEGLRGSEALRARNACCSADRPLDRAVLLLRPREAESALRPCSSKRGEQERTRQQKVITRGVAPPE